MPFDADLKLDNIAKRKLEATEGSLSSLKKQLADAKRAKTEATAEDGESSIS